jgi:hypothetical protein
MTTTASVRAAASVAAEYVTRDEHLDAIRRLEEADGELGRALVELERAMRADYESKISDAVTQMKEAISSSNDDLKGDIGQVQDHLTWQDRTVGGAVVLFFTYLLLHFVVHIHF